MSTRMLIDTRHSEETRVTIVKGNRVEEFDYESSTRRQLKGNIYLARVTRVEPSLQAAFVEYGGNRHGFLAFSEIHPDYYQIPAEDREELLAAEMAAVRQVTSEEDEKQEKPKSTEEESLDEDADGDQTEKSENEEEAPNDEDSDSDAELEGNAEAEHDSEVEEAQARRRALKALKRRYNIQEVIKKRQVLLVQVVKEERGNKGAALTTYLSLAGRYCVLMPNSTHGGGISRKISNISDRKKLKTIINSLNIEDDMGLIIRTAGMKRTKVEIKRDYEYLSRLWTGIRELTLKSIAPALIYEEANLIKRTIRDLYTREIDEVLVEGERGYRAAKDFMKLLMPSHSKKVRNYKDNIPLFHRYQVENHLEAMYEPIVQLKSGGYIVINPTEALISIDVNSGRATKEHNIEETAIKTNLEAAEEVARQLKLRDMAGLIVIDFIDMEERSNNRSVERRMKEVLKTDRARIQVGRISNFGLMEMSRQRMRPNLLEASMETCKTCKGTGVVKSIESAALTALRNLEEEGIRSRSAIVRVIVCPEVAVYLLNKKRSIISELEARYNFYVEIVAKTDLGPSDLEIEREAGSAPTPKRKTVDAVVSIDSIDAIEDDSAEDQETSRKSDDEDEKSEDDKPQRKRRRRRRRRKPDNQNTSEVAAEAEETDGETSSEEENEESVSKSRNRRRRGRRGGRGRRPENGAEDSSSEETDQTDAQSTEKTEPDTSATEEVKEEKPRRRRRTRKSEPTETGEDKSAKIEIAQKDGDKSDPQPDQSSAEEKAEKPKRTRRPRKKPEAAEGKTDSVGSDVTSDDNEKPKKPVRRRRKKEESAETAVAEEAPASEGDKKPARKKKVATEKTSEPQTPPKIETAGGGEETDDKPKRKGWWQRTFG